MIEDEYLDPDRNPLIARISEPEPFKPGEPGSDGRAPFDLAEPLAVSIARKLDTVYPGQHEVTVGDRRLVRMADGSFTESGRPIAELAPADLLEIDSALSGS